MACPIHQSDHVRAEGRDHEYGGDDADSDDDGGFVQ